MATRFFDRLCYRLWADHKEVTDHLAAQESREQRARPQDDGMTRVPGLLRRTRWGVDGLVSRRAKTDWRGD